MQKRKERIFKIAAIIIIVIMVASGVGVFMMNLFSSPQPMQLLGQLAQFI